MKQTRKRLTAWLLSIAMVFSMAADVLPAAFAAGEGAAAPAHNLDFGDSQVTRRPGLYVDFLGDNNNYLSPSETSSALGTLKTPADEDQSAETNPTPTNGVNTWHGYKQEDVIDGTIFWVGVGIDRMNVLDLFQQDDLGIYSLELGFYYDSEFIEPYTGEATGTDSDAYFRVIEAANINNPNYPSQWSDDYKLIAAETALMPQVEPVTQEKLGDDSLKPDQAEIMDPDGSWRMTYVSLEKTGTGNSRFTHTYAPDKEAEEDGSTQYILMIPFRLKKYDVQFQSRVCLRLIRNASMLSIGGGDDGASPYAAWEKVTVRNKDRELKLMTNFQGDLNIFSGNKVKETPFVANLIITNPGGVGNKAELSVTNDPSPNPVKAVANGESITGLYGGTGMDLDVTLQSGYKVTVIVCTAGFTINDNNEVVDESGNPAPGEVISRTEYWPNDAKGYYTFIMPDRNVDVHVIFELTQATEFWLYLSEDHSKEEPAEDSGTITPNSTVLTATHTYTDDSGNPQTDVVTVDDSTSRDNAANLPGEKVEATSKIEIDVQLHHDYNAEIRIYNWATQLNMPPDMSVGVAPDGATMDENTNMVTMTKSGKLILNSMPQSDVIVYVEYVKATPYRATLKVDHVVGTEILPTNVAQLETTVYTDDDNPMTAYSGIVYHDDKGTDPRGDDDHSAVHPAASRTYPIPKVDASTAALSGSLGGDGDPPRAWNSGAQSIMAQVFAAGQTATDAGSFAAALQGKVAPYDLRSLDVKSTGDGLRKNQAGDFFTDNDLKYTGTTSSTVPEFYNMLYTMTQRAVIDGVAQIPVYETPGDTTSALLYTYYDLTPAQVQMYVLEYMAAQAAGGDVRQVPIQTDADARTELAKPEYTWYEPSPGSKPPTASDNPFIEVRSGRQVAVLLEADSAYTVLTSIVIKDVNPDPLTRHPDVTLVVPQDGDIKNGDYKDRDPNYQNVYLFDMPDYDCEVWVTYGLRETSELRLSVTGDNGDPGNTVSVVGYTPTPNPPGSTTAQAQTITQDGEKIENILVGSTATVTVHVATGYEVIAEVISVTGTVSGQVTTNPPIRDANQKQIPLTDGTVFTFTVEDCEYMEVRIIYTRTDKEINNAHIRAHDYPGSLSDARNKAVWTSNGRTDMVAAEDDLLEGTITVAPGFYIHSVTTYTKDGETGPYLGAGYPFFLESNGWNNGAGGTVRLTTTMPADEYWVEVTFRQGPPTREPEQPLAIVVRDEDNVGPATFDNNNAQATISRTAGGSVTLGPVGKTQGSMYSRGYAIAGETVQVEFHPQSGYYVESVEVQPGVLGVPVAWTSGTTAEFVMPAASAAVVVTFRKENPSQPRKPLYLTLDKREQGGSSQDNFFNHFTSLTIQGTGSTNFTVGKVPLPGTFPTGAFGTGAARAGETVDVSIHVDAGWYIHSLTVTGDDGRLSYELDHVLSGNGYNGGAGGDVTASFVMPNSDATVVVNYRKGPPPEEKNDFEMELMVVDPDNVKDPEDPTSDYADNWAEASISGQSTKVGAVGRKKAAMRDSGNAKAGDKVVINYDTADGYSLDIIIITPTGLKIPVTYLEGGEQAEFTMPAEDVTVLVRFKAGEPNHYTANLVLHMPNLPDGTSMPLNRYDTVGKGSFNIELGGIQYNLDPGSGRLYSMTAVPGQRLDVDLWAMDGYYIREVSVAAASLGVGATLSGAFGRQESTVIMPAADIQINVYFAAGWPDDVKEYDDTVNYDLTLEVYDSSASRIGTAPSTANFVSIGGNVLSAPNDKAVKGSEKWTITPRQAYDDDLVMVALHPADGCYVESIDVTDEWGRPISWRYVPGGLAFETAPSHVTVTVWYGDKPEYDPDDPDDPNRPEERMVTLHIIGNDGADSASLTDGVTTISTDGSHITVLETEVGKTLTLTATPDRGIGHTLWKVYGVEDVSGKQLIVPITLVPDGGSVDFAMPAYDADVYVYFTGDSTQQPDPNGDDLRGTLIVAGPGNSGSAELYARVDDAKDSTTGTVAASSSGTMYAPRDTELVVDLDVKTGYSISVIRVTDGQGNRVPYTWNEAAVGSQKQFTLAMPVTGVQVYVELEEIVDQAKPLTAQVVVNNGGGTGNTAKLRTGTTPAGGGSNLLRPVYAGNQIFLDITVQPGYQIEYVKMVPVRTGIAPSLYDSPIEDQTSFFTMPWEDVVIYVKFIRDDRTRLPVTLKTEGDATPGNEGYITSIYSGRQGPALPPTGTSSVLAAPATATLPAEWVDVEYYWASDCSVASVTVLDASNNPVPFTQLLNDNVNRIGKLRLPMINSTVTVTVVYQKEVDPPKYPAILHAIDLDDPTAVGTPNWGKLIWDTTNILQVNANGDGTLMVPAGETVTVNAHAEAGVYIQAAYVLYRAGGQMISFNFQAAPGVNGFPGDQSDTFVMHPDQVDVYVYFTRTPPQTTDYAAVLMIESPADDTTSTATITNQDADLTYQVGTATVVANTPPDGHGYVTATEGDNIEVRVTPAPGYVIDSILMTPLGTSSDQGGSVVPSRRGNQYSFSMPGHNVAVRVKLRKSSSGEYKAYLHYRMADNSATNPKTDWASLTYTDNSGAVVTWDVDGSFELVNEGIDVTLGVSMDKPNVVLAAYVLREDGYMETLNPALEGTGEGASDPDDTKLDATALFTMPASDVHVFVWFTDDPPDKPWRTAVLTVTDDDGVTVNSGKNSAYTWSSTNNPQSEALKVDPVPSTGLPGHHFMWVEEGETVTIKTNKPADGYTFSHPASITHSVSTPAAAATTLTETTADRMEYTYTYTVGAFNSAVRAHFTSSTIVKYPLKVVLVDQDNPGNGSVTNVVNVTPGAMTPLMVQSTTPAGAWQRIPDVERGTLVNFTVRPSTTPPPGYSAVAKLKHGTTETILPLTPGATPGTFVGQQFSMPDEPATLEVTFFMGRQVTLTVWDTRGMPVADAAQVSAAQLTESAFGAEITDDTSDTAGKSFAIMLPDGTDLTAVVAPLPADTRLIRVLAIDDGTGTHWLSATTAAGGGEEYHATVSGRDMEIRVVVGPQNVVDPDDQDYVASVSAVNLPAGTAAPEIHVTPDPNASEGPGWTVANPGNDVTVTATVPYGYKAVLTSGDVTLPGTPPIEIDGPSLPGDPTVGTVTFTMPASNVHVTVTYVKTRFTATLLTGGTGEGRAELSDGTTTVTATSTPVTTGVIPGLTGTETLTYTATPDSGSTLNSVVMTTQSGGIQLLTTGSVPMLEEDVTITAIFDKDGEEEKHHIAYVTVAGATDGLPANSAQSIVNTTDGTLGGGTLWAYGDANHNMLAAFTVAPGYLAVATAKRLDDNTPISVGQQGTTNAVTSSVPTNATAKVTMPDADVLITITYYKQDNPPPDLTHELKLRLVGHDGQAENHATLTAGAQTLAIAGDADPTGADVITSGIQVDFGTSLDLDAARGSQYVIYRATIESGGTVVDLNLNHYGTTATSLFFMPNADAVVTVYYRLPYKATLFVVDTEGMDYDGGSSADTAAGGSRVPKVTLSVSAADGSAVGATTRTHDPITELYGDETVTATVDLATLDPNTEVASVIATTYSGGMIIGTVHLIESAPGSGIYIYPMQDPSHVPPRLPADVDVTVVLRDKAKPKMYTATVYKEGHDDLPGNSATILNTTSTTINGTANPLPTGDIWTGAYEKDDLVVEVKTEANYYAVVTAVEAGTPTSVPVLQWTTVGPFDATFVMPAADVDVTVTYTKTPPKADLVLELKGHAGLEDNLGKIYGDIAATPDPVADPTLTPILEADGGDAVTPPVPPATDPTIKDPYDATKKDVEVGTYLTTTADHANGYYIKSITFETAVGSFTYDLINDTSFVPRLPVGGAKVIVEFAQGKQSGRPFDPEHSERYFGTAVTGGNYVTGGTGEDNPDLTEAPKLAQQGWILATSPDADAKTVVVTIPTLYDEDPALAAPAKDADALSDAGAAPVPDGDPPNTPPTYKFYWWDKDNSAYVELKLDVDYTVESQRSLNYNENPKGNFPVGATPPVQHYGYEMKLKAVDTSTAPLAEYIETGGAIYVTATRPGNVDDSVTPLVPWTESLMTQVIIRNDDIPKPSDPDNTGSKIYEERWIHAQNWVDYLLVTVPTLDTDGKHPISVDGEHVSFKFYLGTSANREPDKAIDVTNLLTMINPNIYFNEEGAEDSSGTPYDKPHMAWDTRDIAYPGADLKAATAWTPSGYTYEADYENEVYYTRTETDGTKTDFNGARFVLKILSEDEIKALGLGADEAAAIANAKILREIWNNYGTMSDDGFHQHRLYISAVNDSSSTPKESGLTDFEVPPYYTLSGILESYAPAHAATFSLYAEPLTNSDVDQSDLSDLKVDTPFLIYQQRKDWDFGSGLWQLEYMIRTSELMGDYTMLIEKAGHVSFLWQGMELSEDTLDPADTRKLTFTVAGELDDGGNEIVEKDGDRVLPGVIALFGGDINGDRYVQVEDYTVLSAFFGGQLRQNRSDETNPTKWVNSVYNPESAAYKADLDGDQYVSSSDHAIWNTERNYNKNYTDYVTPRQLRTGATGMVTAAEAMLLQATELPPVQELLPEGELPAEPPIEEENPSEEEKSPTEETDPSTEKKDPAAEEEKPPAEEKDPAAEEETPPTEKKDPAAEEEIPPTEEKDPVTEEEKPSEGEDPSQSTLDEPSQKEEEKEAEQPSIDEGDPATAQGGGEYPDRSTDVSNGERFTETKPEAGERQIIP